MLMLASLLFADGTWTITPEEPGTLQLAITGIVSLAIYSVLTNWRFGKRIAVVDAQRATMHAEGAATSHDVVAKRAA